MSAVKGWRWDDCIHCDHCSKEKFGFNLYRMKAKDDGGVLVTPVFDSFEGEYPHGLICYSCDDQIFAGFCDGCDECIEESAEKDSKRERTFFNRIHILEAYYCYYKMIGKRGFQQKCRVGELLDKVFEKRNLYLDIPPNCAILDDNAKAILRNLFRARKAWADEKSKKMPQQLKLVPHLRLVK